MSSSKQTLAERVAELERAAHAGDPTAMKKITEIEGTLNKKGRGRPVGAKTTFTDPEKSLDENISLAHFGKGSIMVAGTNSAAGLLDQLEITLRKQPAFRWLDDPDCSSESELMKLADRQTLALSWIRSSLAPKILERFEANELEFFKNIAEYVERKVYEPQLHACLIYIRWMIERNPEHRFSPNELIEKVNWPRDEHGKPRTYDESTIRRVLKRFGLTTA